MMNEFLKSIDSFDHTTLSYINRPFNPVLNTLAMLSIYLMYFVIFLLFYFLYIEKRWKSLKRYVNSSILGFIFVYVLKYIIHRPRPSLFPLVEKVDPSFPSTHSFFSGFLLYVSTHEKIPSYLKIICLLFSVLIPFVKMYIGVHYPSDVVVGFILGYVFPGIVFEYLGRISKRFSKNKS